MKKLMMLALLWAGPVLADEVAVEGTKHTVVKGDHLWGLSKHYYQNPYKWRAIHTANPFIKDPHWIYPGQILTIPDASVAAATPDEPFPPARMTPAMTAAIVEAPKAAAPPPPPAAPVPMDSLSIQLPEQMSGGYPSMTRLKAPDGWDADGVITGLEDREIMAAQGDVINGRVGGKPLKHGDKLYVLRKDAVKEADDDKKATYLVRVGTVEVRRKITGGFFDKQYRLLILKSGDSLQTGDLLSRTPL